MMKNQKKGLTDEQFSYRIILACCVRVYIKDSE